MKGKGGAEEEIEREDEELGEAKSVRKRKRKYKEGKEQTFFVVVVFFSLQFMPIYCSRFHLI